MLGSLFIVAAPSGAGKTSLVKALLAKQENMALSVSHTTRPAREGEQEAKDYFFVGEDEFYQMRDRGEFLESARVFDNHYGTSSASVERQLQAGTDVLLEIDWQGAKQVRENHPDCTGIFILPPSQAELEVRLRSRGQDDETIIQRRMADAKSEMSHYDEFDYVVVNDDFEVALSQLMAIVCARRHSLVIQRCQQAALLESLLA